MGDVVNLFDLGVVLIIGLSALLSFFRGFMKEILSLGAWMGASIITLIALPTVSQWLEPQIKSSAIATAIASVGTFFTALILISLATGILAKFFKTGAKIGLFDNLLGLVFGVARGVLIVAIAYFVMTIIVAEKDYPEWMKKAKTRPYVQQASVEIAKITTDSIDTLTKNDDKNKLADDKINSMIKKAKQESDEMNVLDKPMEEKPAMPSLKDLQERIRQENEKIKESQ